MNYSRLDSDFVVNMVNDVTNVSELGTSLKDAKIYR